MVYAGVGVRDRQLQEILNRHGGIQKGQVVAYMVKPGILPRIHKLFFSGFHNFTYLIALVYHMVGLLPKNHPFLHPANKEKYSLLQVLREAAKNLVFRRQNIDQIIIYFVVLLGVFLMGGFFLSMLFFVMVGTASAQVAAPPGGFSFITPNPGDDVALTMLDMVFGIPGMFGSNALTNTPFHQGLHFLFTFYTTSFFYVAVLIFLYMIASVVTETAMLGQPFGQRFNTIWAPLRLIVAIGLLIPLNGGFSTGQYIVLYAAKYGSGLATNAWIAYNSGLSNPLGLENRNLIAIPKAPDYTDLIKHLFLLKVCKKVYEDYVIEDTGAEISAYYVGYPNRYDDIGAYTNQVGDAYDAGEIFYNYGDFLIRFGRRHDAFVNKERGGVFPFCGDLIVPYSTRSFDFYLLRSRYFSTSVALVEENLTVDAATTNANAEMDALADRFIKIYTNLPPDPCKDDSGDCAPPAPTEFNNVLDVYSDTFEHGIDLGINQLEFSSRFDFTQDLLDRGWGGAAIWYNRIAEMNGAFFDVAYEVPYIKKYPYIMEKVMIEKAQKDNKYDHIERFNPNVGGEGAVELEGTYDPQLAELFYQIYRYLYYEAGPKDPDAVRHERENNVVIDMINAIFGTDAMFSMRDNQAASVHPLAQLAGLGKGMLQASIRNYAIGAGSAALGGLAAVLSNHNIGQGISALGGVATSMAGVGITMGVMLFYILPFMPFLYFFFAVGSWVKTIFEALLGAPLWALAHLHLDGEGVANGKPMSGYQLILEIFIRPVLTLFGLIAAMVVFAAMAVVLNSIFNLVVMNLTGFEFSTASTTDEHLVRGAVDQLFFTVIYVVILYMMANSAFKLIDNIPDNITRWINAEAPSFADKEGDPIQGLSMYTAMGVNQYAPQIMGGVTNAAGRLGSTIGTIATKGMEASSSSSVSIGEQKSFTDKLLGG